MKGEARLLNLETAEAGLVLVDRSFKFMAMDQGATEILKPASDSQPSPEPVALLPKEILEGVRSQRPGAAHPLVIPFRVGNAEYVCRAYLLQPQSSALPQQMIALHLQRNPVAGDAVGEIAAQYRLTIREQQVLKGISLGFGTKDLAHRLNISPSTVKAFIRLIMVKMGVNTRSELFALILKCRSMLGGGTAVPGETRRVPHFRKKGSLEIR